MQYLRLAPYATYLHVLCITAHTSPYFQLNFCNELLLISLNKPFFTIYQGCD